VSAIPLFSKSLEAIRCSGFLTVYEGAVRSAKTVTSLVQFYRLILSSRDSVFLMTGNTLGSISRNCIYGDFGFIAITGWKAVPKTDTDGSKYLLLNVPKGDKRKEIKIYYCGADNDSSYKKIRGLTIGGWYADEIQLHAKSFIETALQRSFAALDRFNIWTLNPDVPSHFIYKEYIDKYLEQKLPGYNYFHFTLDDNPALTDARKAEIKAQFSGVFYQRYVLGLRVRAEGGCYPSFSNENILDALPEETIIFAQIGSDIGGSGSATVYTLTGFFIRKKQLCAVLLDEMFDSQNKSTESILANFKQFVMWAQEKYQVGDAYTDSAEQLIKKSMQNLGIINTHDSLKKPILDRIRFEDLMFSQRRLFIMRHCKNAIEAVQSAVWNEKSEKEERLDDGTINIDSLDSWEYSFENIMRDF
jgi:PBSX family phage terminase large subunit